MACMVICAAFGANDLAAQITPIDYISGAGRFTIRSRVPMNIMIPYEPHLYMDERMTKIELLDGTMIEGFYKYNVENETLEHASSEQIYSLKEVKRFWFLQSGDKPEEAFVNIRLVWPKSEYGGFFKTVKSSEYVWIKYYLEFKPRDYDPVMDMGNPYDRVEMANEFYINLNDVWTAVPQTKGDFFKLMAPYADEAPLKKFMRKNKIKLTEAEDLGKVINWVAKNGK